MEKEKKYNKVQNPGVQGAEYSSLETIVKYTKGIKSTLNYLGKKALNYLSYIKKYVIGGTPRIGYDHNPDRKANYGRLKF